MPQPPAQPNQPQYQTSALNLFPVYASRATYQQATGQQAPPFDPSKPIKGWADPAPASDPITYTVFDPGAPPNVAVGTGGGYGVPTTLPPMHASQASRLNLPGVYVYPAYVSPPTDAQQVGPYGPVGNLSPALVCMQADAQEIANEIAPLYPGQTLNVLQQNTGVFHNVYGLDPRRAWVITIGAGSAAPAFNAQTLIEAKNAYGVGAPGLWKLVSNQPTWTAVTPVTAPPAGAITLCAPIRSLLPNEQLVHLPGSLFTELGTWVVERTDLPQSQPPETNDQQFADLKASLASIQAGLGAILTKLGA